MVANYTITDVNIMSTSDRHSYTADELEFLADNYPNFDYHQLAVMFNGYFDLNISEAAIKSRVEKLKIAKRKLKSCFGKYTDEMIDWLIKNFNTVPIKRLTEMFNEKFNVDFTSSSVWHKLNRTIQGGIVRDKNNYVPRVKWTNEMIEYLKENYSNYTNLELSKRISSLFNVRASAGSIEHKGNRLGLRKSEDYLKNSASQRKTSPFQFKKGRVPEHKKPIGYERLDKKRGLVFVKVDDKSKFEAKQRVVWREHYGEIPEGHNIIFIDGDKTNFNIDNLACLSNAELGIINRLQIENKTHNKDIGEIKLTLTRLRAKVIDKKGVR